MEFGIDKKELTPTLLVTVDPTVIILYVKRAVINLSCRLRILI